MSNKWAHKRKPRKTPEPEVGGNLIVLAGFLTILSLLFPPLIIIVILLGITYKTFYLE